MAKARHTVMRRVAAFIVTPERAAIVAAVGALGL
jgi:hypothetical protein